MTGDNVSIQARRGRPSAQDTKERQAHLLSVARGIFIQRGYRGTTMDEVAIAAGVTKKTLYAWHQDKEALFHQCVIFGAQRFPDLQPHSDGDVRTALRDYAIALHQELAHEESYALGILLMREGPEFPELAKLAQRPHHDFLLRPLAKFLTEHGMEAEGQNQRAALFINMALSPLHNFMMLGLPLPSDDGVRAHGEMCAGLFCAEVELARLQSKDSSSSTNSKT
jgi:TetR/AcrR family transcriptional repressor of mexJK operon